jgi:hypothetical protein
MIVLEVQAKQYLCPIRSEQYNRFCVGKECMMWIISKEFVGYDQSDKGIRPQTPLYKESNKGYCGLAYGKN